MLVEWYRCRRREKGRSAILATNIVKEIKLSYITSAILTNFIDEVWGRKTVCRMYIPTYNRFRDFQNCLRQPIEMGHGSNGLRNSNVLTVGQLLYPLKLKLQAKRPFQTEHVHTYDVYMCMWGVSR